jgi:hypothetical protein
MAFVNRTETLDFDDVKGQILQGEAARSWWASEVEGAIARVCPMLFERQAFFERFWPGRSGEMIDWLARRVGPPRQVVVE